MLIKSRGREEGVCMFTYTSFLCLLRTIYPISVLSIVPLSCLVLVTMGRRVLKHMVAPSFEVVLNEEIFVVMVIGTLESYIHSQDVYASGGYGGYDGQKITILEKSQRLLSTFSSRSLELRCSSYVEFGLGIDKMEMLSHTRRYGMHIYEGRRVSSDN